MFTDALLAAALLTGPAGDVPDAATLKYLYPRVRSQLMARAIRMEIMDPRECRLILARAKDFAEDLKLLRRRYHDLRDAPPLAECYRLPSREIVTGWLRGNHAYREHVANRSCVELLQVTGWELVRETDDLYRIWEEVRDAQCDYYNVSVRRRALQKLRELAGEEAYYSGNLPPPVPLWRFRLY